MGRVTKPCWDGTAVKPEALLDKLSKFQRMRYHRPLLVKTTSRRCNSKVRLKPGSQCPPLQRRTSYLYDTDHLSGLLVHLPVLLSPHTVMLSPSEIPQELLRLNSQPFQVLEKESLQDISQRNPLNQYRTRETWEVALKNDFDERCVQVDKDHLKDANRVGPLLLELPAEQRDLLFGILRCKTVEGVKRGVPALGPMLHSHIQCLRDRGSRSSLTHPRHKRSRPIRKQPKRKCKQSAAQKYA